MCMGKLRGLAPPPYHDSTFLEGGSIAPNAPALAILGVGPSPPILLRLHHRSHQHADAPQRAGAPRLRL
jgi:hypothetical protein